MNTNKRSNAHPSNAAYLGIPAAAEYTHTSQDTIRRMIARGELKAYRFGARAIRIRLADIEAAMRSVQ